MKTRFFNKKKNNANSLQLLYIVYHVALYMDNAITFCVHNINCKIMINKRIEIYISSILATGLVSFGREFEGVSAVGIELIKE